MYIPILKFKQAEEMALRSLSDSEKKQVTPLLQLVHKNKRIINSDGTTSFEEIPRETILISAVKRISKHLSKFPEIYFDPRPLFSAIDDAVFDELITNCEGLYNLNTNIVPVLTVKDIENNNFNVKSRQLITQQGICLRIFKDEITEKFWQNIDSLLEKMSLKRENVNIVFDYKITEVAFIKHFCNETKESEKLLGWRSIAFASGAFPKDFIGKTPNTYKFERSDWLLWKELIRQQDVSCDINFSDYSIQHPVYAQLNTRVNPSRSIRYALEDKWIVMKGQSDTAEGSAKSEQYFAHASMLVRKGYVVKNCCEADSRIIQLSNNPNEKKGGFQSWIKLGIIHHTSLTLRQIANSNS